jgi:hypothetical protein
MKSYRYKVYNPKMQSLEQVLNTEPIEHSWLFVKVVAVTDYEWVAIFEVED